MPAKPAYRRVTYDLFLVQGLYVGRGWVTLLSTYDRDEAEARQRQLRAKNPQVAYQIDTQRVRTKPTELS
jgi:hypothetical protein